jgi:hypothetical protein
MADVIELARRRKTKVPPAPVQHEIVVLEQAVNQVRAIEEKIQAAEGEACHLAIDVGDALAPIRKTIGRGRWLGFLKACGLSARVAQIRLQLAANRSVIEAANANRDSHLSIAEALALIRPKKSESTSAEATGSAAQSIVKIITVEDVLTWLPTASQADKRKVAVWLAQDTAAIRKTLPPKALPSKATAKQVYDRALGLLAEVPTAH